MRSRIAICLGGLALVCLALASVATAQNGDIPRTLSGHPDLSGTYDVATLTPVQRPTELGEKMREADPSALVAFLHNMIRRNGRDTDIYVRPEDMREFFQTLRSSQEAAENMMVEKNLFIEGVLPGAINCQLTEDEHNAYRAPWIDPEARKILCKFPQNLCIGGEPKNINDMQMAYMEKL